MAYDCKDESCLTGRYVQGRSKDGEGFFGLYTETVRGEGSEGWVFDFASRRRLLVLDADCEPLELYQLTGGFVGLSVTTGGHVYEVYDEYTYKGALHFSVKGPDGNSRTVSVNEVKVVTDASEEV